MKRTKLTIIAMSAAMMTLFAFSANAGPRGQRDGEGRRDKIEHMKKHLDLTPAQETQVRGLKANQKEMSKKIRADIKTLRKKMQAAWKKENPNRKEIIRLHKKIHAAKGKLAEQRIDFRLGVHNILTPDQRDKAREMMERRHERKGEKCDGKRGKKGRKGNRRHGKAASL